MSVFLIKIKYPLHTHIKCAIKYANKKRRLIIKQSTKDDFFEDFTYYY